MKAYKCNYNPDTQRLELMEFEIDHEYDFSHDPSSNLYGEDGSHTLDHKTISDFVSKTNEEIEKNQSIVFQCRDCRKYEIMKEDEILWYKDRGFSLPKRCYDCRGKRKKK